MSKFIEVTGSSGSPLAKVVFFHGLEGSADSTWQTAGDDTFWPRWLVQDIPGLKATAVDYETKISNWQSETMAVYDRAVNVAAYMTTDAELLTKPVILIGHSLGGLIIKELIKLLSTYADNNAKYKALLNNIRVVGFLGTPHRGAQLASWADSFKSIVRPSPSTGFLAPDDAASRELDLWYRTHVPKHIRHLVFSETKKTGFFGKVVRQSSADPALPDIIPTPVDRDHKQICKLPDRDDIVYLEVILAIKEAINAEETRSSVLVEQPAQPSKNPKPPRGSRVKGRMSAHKDALVEVAEEKPFVVLLCGPKRTGSNPSASARLCEVIRQELENDKFEVVLGEEAGVDNPRINKHHNSIRNELNFIKANCNAVVLIADSIGTWCELGLYSWQLVHDKDFDSKRTDFVALVDHNHSNTSSFFVRGPFAFADGFGKAEFIDFSTYEPNRLLDRLRERRSVFSMDRRGRPRKSV